ANSSSAQGTRTTGFLVHTDATPATIITTNGAAAPNPTYLPWRRQDRFLYNTILVIGSNRPFAGDFYLPLEDNSPEVERGSNKKVGSSQRKKSSTPLKKKIVQPRSKKASMVKLNLDVVDSDEEFELPKAAPPTGLRPEKAPITHGRGKGLMGGLLAESRRAEEARLEREQQKEAAKRKLRAEEKKKAEAEAKRKKKRADEEKEMAKSIREKKRSAHEALGSGDQAEKVARFNTVGLPVEVDHLYAGAVVRVGDGDESSSSPYDFVFDFRGGGKHISQVPLACLQFVRCVRGGADFLSPPEVDSSSSDPDTRFAMSAVSMLAGYNFLSDARHSLDQRNRELNAQNSELVSESSRLKEARTRAESEVAKLKDLLNHSQGVNGELIASRDDLSSKVDALTLALTEAEEAKKEVESRIEGELNRRRRARRDPDVTLAYASVDPLDTFVPMGIPLARPSDRGESDAASPRIDLPEHQFDDVPQMMSRDLSSGGSSYARSGGDSKISETSNRVETEEGTSGGEKGSLVDFRNAEPKSPGPGLGHGIRLDDSNDVGSSMDSSRVYALTPAGGWEGISIVYPQANDRPWSPPSGYMCVYECFIKNGGLCFPIPRLLLQYCHRRRISLSQLTHGSIRAMMAVVVLAAEHGGVVNLDEFEEISSFSAIGNSGRFYVSPRGGYQLVKGHSSQVNRHRWSRYFYVEISRRTIGEFSKPIRVGWNFRPVEPVKRKTPVDSVVTLLRKDKKHIHHWPDFLSHRIARSYPRIST
ncbi:hypothetical protein AALP_AAs74289U000100, partial [Arabis alpina]